MGGTMTDRVNMSAAELKAMNQPESISVNTNTNTTEPYLPGQKDIPSATFDRKRVPKCIWCKKESVDFWDYQGSVDLEFFCDEETCGVKWQRNKQREREQQAREQREKGFICN
jgi:hypothetical protein